MGFIRRRSSMIAIAVAIVLGAGAIAFARPHQISEPLLGTEWQCSRAAFVVTCNHRRDGAAHGRSIRLFQERRSGSQPGTSRPL